jgi:uncharacterized protein (DUF1684 family)
MNPQQAQAYSRQLQTLRQEKDAFFREEPDSPISARERATFTGLRYFAPEPTLRVEARVERLPLQQPVVMATSDGSERHYERYALLHFTVDGQPVRLTAYRSTGGDEDESLFIPFRDTLAGSETYGAGRYLEVDPPHQHDGGEHVVLDFNLAYNPYCAYNEYYSCPIPPRENTLPVEIRAGERIYHDA